ncbi:hypothetical protein COX93_01325 [Candidatus Nomurabacteria bacterium CG_4_10_14_0_2_um_filter_30_12]|uniref:Thioredoxin domain-containing protein n=1 Tax=Candidatus Nomurabacteria bacterium CG_4_10_14_0_2_um_filter_30_12 TaxID=1974727 RepID=A0A2J0MR70_9BACT|nr:MAG: hypothetical protein COX93_01325 [Candidatus Nomurabacteria bacterium CG_4_10_14_0_2_um_filter_30_12]
MSNKNIFISIIILLILGTVATILIRSNNRNISPTKYDEFAQCLASKKLTMYGAVWCPHCKTQKALFGDSFKYVPYIECTETPDLCIAKGIEGYPTWIEEKGQKYDGEQSLEKLSEISNCQLPIN